jgi:flagellar biogenesis protein FliO
VLGAAAIFVVKRLLPRLGISQGRQVRVLETVYLGPRKSLYVVQVGDRTLLVSGTRERLGLLADVTGSVPPSDETPPGTAPGTPATRFRIPGTEPETA